MGVSLEEENQVLYPNTNIIPHIQMSGSLTNLRMDYLTMMPNFRVAMEIRSYSMPNKVGADAKTILMGYLALRKSRS